MPPKDFRTRRTPIFGVVLFVSKSSFGNLQTKETLNIYHFYPKAMLVYCCIERSLLSIDNSIDCFTFAERDACVQRKQLTTQKHQKVVGVAIYFFTYSTWEGPVLYVEDLFVIPAVRGKLTDARLV